MTVVGALAGGAAPSGMFTVAVWRAFVWPMVFVVARVLPVVGLTETETLTLDSSLSPWLANLTVRVGLFDQGTRLTTPGASGCSVTAPTLVLTSPWPCRPGAGWPDVPDEPLLALRPRCEATVAGASHEMSGMKRLPAICWPLTPFLSRPSLMSGATRWE